MTNIQKAKQLRVDINNIINHNDKLALNSDKANRLVLETVYQKLQESRMWLGIYLRDETQLPSPYPESENPENNIVSPEADV
jgi:putative methionine-R-sulfoxide reductase with GAF domain